MIDGLYEYDFEFTVRSDGMFTGSRPRREVDVVIAAVPGIVPDAGNGFVYASDAGHRVELRPQFRVPDDGVGTRVDRGDEVNCVHVFIPSCARGPALERGYLAFALDVADRLGWELHDDTDSGTIVSRARLDAWHAAPARPWWKLW